LARQVRWFLRRNALPKVLAIPNRAGWAIDYKAKNIKQALADRFDVSLRYEADVTEADVKTADIVLVFYWLELQNMKVPESVFARRHDRLLMGICSHVELDGKRREPGLAMLRRLPRAVFVNSKILETEFSPLMSVPVHYTPNGMDSTFFTPAPEPIERAPGELRVGWAGSLKNHGSAHRRFHEVIEPAAADVPGARLVTAIREEHWRDHDEMLDFYRGLDVYVCASVSEGTPNPCLEAAACGVPVITTRVGNMPEFIDDGVNGCFFDGTTADLVAQLTHLRDDVSLRSSMGRRIRQTAESWDWSVQSLNYARMFESML
jgi:glycosyltransferase involved in cell wall biosynthesis